MKEFYFSRKFILLLILLVIYFLWADKIITAYDTIIVKPFFSSIKDNGINFFIFFCLYETTTFYFIYWFTLERRIRNEIAFSSLFILINYLWFRIIDKDRYSYTAFYNTSLSYSDYFAYLFGGILVLKTFESLKRERSVVKYDNPFLIDKPWHSGKKDLFGRSQFAEALANKIQSALIEENAGALAIGINGVWGSGKTSFLNRIKSFIIPQGRILIQFNPWRSASPSKIIEDFFELIIDELTPYAPHLSNKISDYAKSITKINENVFAKSLDNISDFLFEERSLNEKYEEINNAISSLNKQIIIFVDDLDRLDKKEIVEVLRLIRNTANFNKVVYIVAYDKDYILEAVKDINPRNYSYFLEKIFQFEFSLTKYDNTILREGMKAGLDKLPDAEKQLVYKSIDQTSIRGEFIAEWFIKSQRDVIRFLNSFQFEIKNIKTEVNYADFYYLQLIKLKYPTIHQLLYQLRNYFFIAKNGTLELRTLKEKDWDEAFYNNFRLFDDENKTKANDKETDTIFSQFVSDSELTTNFNEIEKNNIVNTVRELIKIKEYDESTKVHSYKCIGYAENFDKYFSYQLLASDLPAGLFEKVRREDFNAYKTKIEEWLNEGRLNQITDRLSKIQSFTTFEECENHFKIWIEIGKYQLRLNGRYNVNYREALETLHYPNQDNKLKYFETKDAYYNYIIKFFEDAPDPFVYESNLLTAALTHVVSFALSDKEIYKQIFNYFKQYCSSHQEITVDFRFCMITV